MTVRRALALGLLAAVLAVAGCTPSDPDGALCGATVQLAEHAGTGELPDADVEAFAAAAPEADDGALRQHGSDAAELLGRGDTAAALAPLGEVFDRCVELGLIDPAG